MADSWTIYCHTHTATGRRYIGLTRLTMMKRWNQHIYNSKRLSPKTRSHFRAAIRKYGPEAFSHEVLEVCHGLEVANLAEECWIEFYDTRNPERGFNLAKGGQHQPHPIRRNPWDDPEWKAAHVSDMAACHTPEIRAKSKAALQRPDVKAKIAAAARMSQVSPESRARRSMISREVTSRPEVLAKISATARRYKTHCSRGHSMADAYVFSNCRVCRQCQTAKNRDRRARLRTRTLPHDQPSAPPGGR